MTRQRDDRNDDRQPSRDGNGISPSRMQHYLKGIRYPSTKSDLLAQARRNDAPRAVLHVLQRLPSDHDFGGPQEVMKAFGDVSNRP